MKSHEMKPGAGDAPVDRRPATAHRESTEVTRGKGE